MSDSSNKLHDNLTARFKSHPEVAKESLSFIRKLGGAPVVILAFRHKPSYTKTDDTIVQSVSAALENMALAAVDRGLGSCWMTAPIETADDLRLQEMFAPERGRMVALMTIGHPAQLVFFRASCRPRLRSEAGKTASQGRPGLTGIKYAEKTAPWCACAAVSGRSRRPSAGPCGSGRGRSAHRP